MQFEIMSLIKVPIDEVKVGMFIEDLDIPWMDSPFLRHKKKLKSAKDIALLKKAGVKIATINMAKSEVADRSVVSDSEPAGADNAESQEPVSPVKAVSEPDVKSRDAQFKESYAAAARLQEQAVGVLDSIAEEIQQGDSIKAEKLKPVIENSLQLIDADNQALISLLHSQRRNKQIQAHSFSVMGLAIGLAEELKIDEKFKVVLATAALLHESGWTRLPLNLFLKGKAFGEKEKALADQHIPIIANILKASEGIDPLVIKTALQHHKVFTDAVFDANSESGIAQILAVANRYDALVHGIGDQTAQLPANAVRALLGLAKQKHFPMPLVTSFIRLVGVYPIGSAVKLSDGSKGVIVDPNRLNPMNPLVRVWYSSDGKAMSQALEKHLAEENLKILEVLNPNVGNHDPVNLLHLESS